jgi:hypothetical protein
MHPGANGTEVRPFRVEISKVIEPLVDPVRFGGILCIDSRQ